MNHFKQLLWVVSILFISMVTTVAVSYAISPSTKSSAKIKKVDYNQGKNLGQELKKTKAVVKPIIQAVK